MSENQSKNFSVYDEMSVCELEEILRMDGDAPEGTGSDTEKMLYILEVLSRKKQINITGNTPQEAWKEFENSYMPVCENKTRRWLPRLAAVAAVLVMLISVPLAADAFGWDAMWEQVAGWAKETFSFVTDDHTAPTEPKPLDERNFQSLQDALKATDKAFDFVPTHIPEGYVLDDIRIYENPKQRTYTANYRCDEKELIIAARSYYNSNPEKVEIDDTLVDIVETAGLKCFIFNNKDQLRAAWITGSYECYISGDLTLEEIKEMLDSIGKG